MRAKYFNKNEKINEEGLQEIALEIMRGKVVVFPTETVYGVGTSALDSDACERVFKIKGRPKNKPFIVLISNSDMLNKIACCENELEKILMETFWPGPLTIILEKKKESGIPDIVTAGKSEIGVRMTSGKIAKNLIEKAGVPIIAPSANLSGNPTGTKMENIIKELGDRVDYILDYGDIEENIESTIVKVENNKIRILRNGKISKQELEKIGEISE